MRPPLSIESKVCGWLISTVLMPVEHPRGAWYETAVAELIGDGDETGPYGVTDRYATRSKAVKGHLRECDNIRNREVAGSEAA